MDSNLCSVSIVMATYNGVRYLREQLESLLAQTLQPDEIIIQDDSSTDGTWSLLEEYAKKQELIKIYRNKGEHGINQNFFSAMERAKGEYIAICDQDDIWEKDKLECQIKAMTDDVLLCSCRSMPFSENGFPITDDKRKPNLHILRMAYVGVLPGHTLVIRKTLFNDVRSLGDFPYLYDWQLQMVGAAAERITYVDKVLVHFRRHAAAATATLPISADSALRWAWDSMWFSIRHHRELQNIVSERFTVINRLLKGVDYQSRSKDECLEMAELQMKRGTWAFIRRIKFFIKHRDNLFYAQCRRDSAQTWIRAILYPFTCGYMYRRAVKR